MINDLIPNIASVDLAVGACKKGDADGYLTYDGTQFSTVMGQQITSQWLDPAKVRAYVVQHAASDYGMTLLDNLGYANTYAVAVTGDFAAQHNLKTVSDLVPYAPNMTIGCDYDFLNRGGAVSYKSMCSTYGLKFKQASGMDLGLMYQAIAKGNVNAIVSWSTDGRIPAEHLVTLADDKNVFPPYDAAFIMSTATLQKYPSLEPIMDKLSGMFTDASMQALNEQVDVNNQDAAVVAKTWLQQKGLL